MGTGRRKVIWSRERKRMGFEAKMAALVKHSSLWVRGNSYKITLRGLTKPAFVS